MGVFDMRDGPSHGPSTADGSPSGEAAVDDVAVDDSPGGDSPGGDGPEGSDGEPDADARIPILEGHAVWFNEYRY